MSVLRFDEPAELSSWQLYKVDNNELSCWLPKEAFARPAGCSDNWLQINSRGKLWGLHWSLCIHSVGGGWFDDGMWQTREHEASLLVLEQVHWKQRNHDLVSSEFRGERFYAGNLTQVDNIKVQPTLDVYSSTTRTLNCRVRVRALYSKDQIYVALIEGIDWFGPY